jgi:hypothetical protein
LNSLPALAGDRNVMGRGSRTDDDEKSLPIHQVVRTLQKKKPLRAAAFFPAGYYARPASRTWLKKKISLL